MATIFEKAGAPSKVENLSLRQVTNLNHGIYFLAPSVVWKWKTLGTKLILDLIETEFMKNFFTLSHQYQGTNSDSTVLKFKSIDVLKLRFSVIIEYPRQSHSMAFILRVNHTVTELQSWTKVLGQIYICGAFSHAPNKQSSANSSTLVQPLPHPPPLQCWTRVHAISPEFQQCIWGGGGEQRILKWITLLFLKFHFKNT